jgi:hypothetical protein
MSENLTAEATSIETWSMAVTNRPIQQNLIYHSDTASQ